jgi:hypothetical protein
MLWHKVGKSGKISNKIIVTGKFVNILVVDRAVAVFADSALQTAPAFAEGCQQEKKEEQGCCRETVQGSHLD